jgi:O-antigen/teichoic acid export membrane protein
MKETSAIDRDFSIRKHLIISVPMILTSFIQLLNGRVDTVMLGLFESQSTGDVGVFTVAFKIAVVTNFMIGAIKSIAMPKISELFWSGRMVNLNQMISKSTRIIFLFAAPVSALLIIFPDQLLSLFKPEFVIGSNTLRIFAVSQLIDASCGLVAVFLNMTGNQIFFTRLVAITTSANILLNWLLIPIYGMEGAAIATLISTASWNIIGAAFIWRKYGVATFFRPQLLWSKW